MRRSKALALVFLGGTLIVGAAAGFTVDRVLVSDRCEESSGRGSLRNYLDRKLHLTVAQRAAVDSILDKRHRDIDAVLDPVRPQLDSVRDAVLDPVRPRLDSIRVGARGEILKVLDSRQVPLFQEMIDESKKDDAKREAKHK